MTMSFWLCSLSVAFFYVWPSSEYGQTTAVTGETGVDYLVRGAIGETQGF